MLKHHPLHPIAIHFPITFLTLASLCDVATLFGYAPAWPPSYALLGLGIITAIIAMMAGLFDLFKIDRNDEVEKTVNMHMMLMSGAWCLYLAALLLRNDNFQITPSPDITSIIFSLLGLITLCMGGWYGGKLVYYHGASVRNQKSG